MTRFLDGPAKGVLLMLRRTPLYLRVTVNRQGIKDKWDALDQLSDEPHTAESVYVYRRASRDGTVHIDYTDKSRRRRGDWFSSASYKFVEVQPAESVLRDNEQWRAWAVEEQAREKANGA